MTDVIETGRGESTVEMRNRNRYVDTLSDFSPEEMESLCQVKRFIECYEGDRDFRKALDDGGNFSDDQRTMLKDIGVTFEPEELALLWEQPSFNAEFSHHAFAVDTFEEMPTDIHETLAQYPRLRAWFLWRFRREKTGFVQKKMVLSTPSVSKEYTIWRARRIATTRNELGSYGWDIDHPCHAVEMAVGCSVGCHFCAFDAPKLQQVYDVSVPENQTMVAGVAQGMADVLGWPAAHGMLYWSTEPHDNPHYVKLLEIWQSVTGASLCTATARAKEDWVGELIGFYSKVPAPWPRISVLSRNIMRRLHKTFTPSEMRDTILLMQQADAEVFRTKVPGGRERMLKQLVESDDLRNIDTDNPPEGFDVPQGSIACVSGLLINMVTRSVRLISPCYTTLENRYGYRVFDEATFEDGEDFKRVLEKMVARSMVAEPYQEMPMKWRDDLKFVEQEDGFTLISPTTRRDFRRGTLHLVTGALISEGTHTYGEIFDHLSDHPEIGPMAAMAMLDNLFSNGYLCEMAITKDYRARKEAENPALRDLEIA